MPHYKIDVEQGSNRLCALIKTRGNINRAAYTTRVICTRTVSPTQRLPFLDCSMAQLCPIQAME